MSIRINLHSLRSYADYQSVVEVSGDTVGRCLEHLMAQFPAIREEIIDADGEVMASIHILINGEGTFPEELARPVNDGDVIDILQLVAGG